MCHTQRIELQDIQRRSVRARYQHIAPRPGNVEWIAANEHSLGDGLYDAVPRDGQRRDGARVETQGARVAVARRWVGRPITHRQRQGLRGRGEERFAVGAAIAEAEQRDRQATPANFGPPIARDTPDQPVGNGRIDILTLGELAQR